MNNERELMVKRRIFAVIILIFVISFLVYSIHITVNENRRQGYDDLKRGDLNESVFILNKDIYDRGLNV